MSASLREIVQQEIFEGEKYSLLQLWRRRFFDPSSDALYLLRCFLIYSAEGTHKIRKNLAHRRLWHTYNIYISKQVEIGIGLKLPHPFGIVFGAGTKLGKNNWVYQHVTFGLKKINGRGDRLYPESGNDCKFFPGSVIIGPIHVAEGTTVGANAVLMNDTEPNSVYAGVPAERKDKCR